MTSAKKPIRLAGLTSEPSPALVGKGLRHKTMAAATAEELRRRILDGVFPAGFALRQDALAEEFGVSRIPLREAFVQLEAEGLVKILPHRGAVVSELSIAEFDELFELRVLIEPRLLRRSAPNLTPDDYKRLRDILAEYSSELRLNHVSRWGELNTEFHLHLYRHASRPKSVSFVAGLLQESDRLTRIQLAFTHGMERAEMEHAELVDLCEAQEFAKAAALLKAHIENVRKTLGAFLRQHHDG